MPVSRLKKENWFNILSRVYRFYGKVFSSSPDHEELKKDKKSIKKYKRLSPTIRRILSITLEDIFSSLSARQETKEHLCFIRSDFHLKPLHAIEFELFLVQSH